MIKPEALADLRQEAGNINWQEPGALIRAGQILRERGASALYDIYCENVGAAPGKTNPHYLKSDLSEGISARNYSQPMPHPEIPHTERTHTHKMIGVSIVVKGEVVEYNYSPATHAGSEGGAGLWKPEQWDKPLVTARAIGGLLVIPSTRAYWHSVVASDDAITMMLSHKTDNVSYGRGDDDSIMRFPDFDTQRHEVVARIQAETAGIRDTSSFFHET